MENSKKSGRIFLFVLLLACMSLLCSSEFLCKRSEIFVCRKVQEGYELVLYEKRNAEFFSMIYPIEPEIINVTEDVLEISVSTGNPSRYVFYYDSKNTKMSEIFFNPISFSNKYVAYMEDDRLIMMDVFGEGILYEEIARDFTKMADPISAIVSIEMLGSGDILLQYYKGEDMEIISELLKCHNDAEPTVIVNKESGENDKAEPVEDQKENPLKANVNIYNSYAQIETDMMHKTVEFPSVEIIGAENTADFINERIYSEIVQENFEQYGNGREDVEIKYEIEIINDEIISIHFWGYQSYLGSYTEYNKGLNFDLKEGNIISLKDYYGLDDIKMIVNNARIKKEINILDIPTETEQQIDSFIYFIDSEEYISCIDIFFIKNNHIYFIVPWDKTERHNIYIEMSLDKFSKLF